MAVGNNNPFIGIDSRIGIAEETTYGTFVTSTVICEFNTESLKQTREEIKIESIAGNRDFRKRVIGNEVIGGTIEMYLNPAEDALNYIIKQAMGGTSTRSTIVAGSYEHTFALGDMESNRETTTATDVKSLSIAVERGNSDIVYNYYGMRVNTLTIKGEIGQPCMVSVDFVGQGMSTSATLPTLSYSNIVPVNFVGISITTGDSITNLGVEYFKSFEFVLNNNLNGDQRVLGSRTITKLPPTRREMTLSLTQIYDTTTSYDRFNENTFTAIKIQLDSYVTITAGGTTYAMWIDIPECYINSTQPEVADSGPLQYEFDCAVLYNTTTSYAAQIVTRNATEAYA